MPGKSVRDLSRQWTGHLASYRRHQNDEHLEALVEEGLRYTGLHLENHLSLSSYWAKAPLSRRVAVLLYLVDRGVVERRMHQGRRLYEPRDDAETWVAAQPALAPYVVPTLEMLAALRQDKSGRSSSARS